MVQSQEGLNEKLARMKAEALAKALPAALAAPAVQGCAETHSNSIGNTAAVGSLPRPPAGPLTTEWSRQGETERRTVLLDRPFPVRDSVRETVPALVPRDRHTAHTSDIRRSTATTSSGPQLQLPPSQTRVTDPDTECTQHVGRHISTWGRRMMN